jgi:hypothetical protein
MIFLLIVEMKATVLDHVQAVALVINSCQQAALSPYLLMYTCESLDLIEKFSSLWTAPCP